MKERMTLLYEISKYFKIFCTETFTITKTTASYQPTKLYGTAKTHKSKDIKEITKEQIKCWPITDHQ